MFKRCRFNPWQGDPLENMATHSNILAWRILMDRGTWWGAVHRVTRVGHDWSYLACVHTMKKNWSGKGIRNVRGWGEAGKLPFSLGSFEKAFKVTFEQRPEGNEGKSHTDICGNIYWMSFYDDVEGISRSSLQATRLIIMNINQCYLV